MNATFLKVLNTSITAGWLVAAVVLLRFLLRKAPKWTRCVLWGLVALRLVFPFTIESGISLLPSAEPVRTEFVAADPAEKQQTAPAISRRVVLRSGFDAVDKAVNPVMAKSGTNRSVSPETVAAWAWAIGAGAMLIYAAASFIYMKFKVRVSIETERGVYICDAVRSPFILGAIRPKIYLPSRLDATSRAHVLAHERAHISRRDHFWKPLGFLLLSFHWFNPLIWVAFILLSRDIEFACDEKVISQLDREGKAAYSGTLLAFNRQHKSMAVCPVPFGEVGVKKRIESVLRYRRSPLRIVCLAMAAVAVVAVCFLTSPKRAKAEPVGETHEEIFVPGPKPSLTPQKKQPQSSAAEEVQQELPQTEVPAYMFSMRRMGQYCDMDE